MQDCDRTIKTSWWKPEKQKADKMQFLWIISKALKTICKKQKMCFRLLQKPKKTLPFIKIGFDEFLIYVIWTVIFWSAPRSIFNWIGSTVKMKKTESQLVPCSFFCSKQDFFLFECKDGYRDIKIHICMYRFRNRYIFDCTSHTSIEIQLAQLPSHWWQVIKQK